MKKILLILLIAALLTSCTTNANKTGDPNPSNPVEDNEPDESTDAVQERYTGEIIVDGFYRGIIFFLPDKETKLLLKDSYGLDREESIPLDYTDKSIESALPQELGIYKAEVKADFSQKTWAIDLWEIKLTDSIGTVEYEGKEYETNDLDENVRTKDRVCGLIVSHVRKFDDGGAWIEFEGEIETEGFYNVYPGGEFFSNLNLGKIVPDEEIRKNIPSYLGVYNNFSVFFTETNHLYKQLAEHSTVGRGRFKFTDYSITYNYGGGAQPSETLTEIISLDKKYKGLFEFDDTKIRKTLSNEANKYFGGFNDKYAIIHDANDLDKNITEPRDYYFFGKESAVKIKLFTTDEYEYFLKEDLDMDSKYNIILESSGRNYKTNTSEKPHTISLKYFDKNSSGIGKDTIRKNYSYGYFKNGNETVRVFEGDVISGMTAEDINIEYDCTQDTPEELIQVRCRFSGETTLTGKLTLYYDEGYNINMVYFVADDEGIKKLPIHDNTMAEQGGIVFENENLEEILGTEPFEKKCEITINNYMIHKAAKDVHDTAQLLSVKFLE